MPSLVKTLRGGSRWCGAEEQLGCDVAIGEPLCDEPGDLQLLGG